MEKIYDINLRLSRPNGSVALFKVVQGDADTRKIRATILNDNGTAYTPDTGTTAEYWSRKSDKTGTQHEASMSGNVVTVTLTEQDLASPGNTYATIVLKNNDEVLTMMPFWFFVDPQAVGADVESINDYQVLQEAVTMASHPSYVDETTYHWMVWDYDEQAYADTGIAASVLASMSFADTNNGNIVITLGS